jgi:glyoxylase I family protein
VNVLRTHHVSFSVSDLARARGFYEGVLGLRPMERPDLGIPGIWYRVGDGEVHLIAAPAGIDTGRPAPKLTPLANHAAFEIEDYDAAEAGLRARGIDFVGLGRAAGQLFVRDPDGNVIELIAPGPR